MDNSTQILIGGEWFALALSSAQATALKADFDARTDSVFTYVDPETSVENHFAVIRIDLIKFNPNLP